MASWPHAAARRCVVALRLALRAAASAEGYSLQMSSTQERSCATTRPAAGGARGNFTQAFTARSLPPNVRPARRRSLRRLLLVQRVRGELRLPPALALVVPVDGAGAPHAAGDAIGRRQELEPAVAGQPAVAAGVDAAREPLEAAPVDARFFDAAREARRRRRAAAAAAHSRAVGRRAAARRRVGVAARQHRQRGVPAAREHHCQLPRRHGLEGALPPPPHPPPPRARRAYPTLRHKKLTARAHLLRRRARTARSTTR